MKIKYFSNLAEQSFSTSPTGERLFHWGGFWSKPFIIPDQEIEKRLFKKQLWMLRIFLGAIMVAQPFFFIAIPDIVETPLGFILYFVVIMLLYWFVNWLVFGKELSTLKRANTRSFIPMLYRELAHKHHTFGLVLGFLASLGFVWAGSWIVRSEINPFVGWVSMIFSGLCAIGWGYLLFLKFTMPKNN